MKKEKIETSSTKPSPKQTVTTKPQGIINNFRKTVFITLTAAGIGAGIYNVVKSPTIPPTISSTQNNKRTTERINVGIKSFWELTQDEYILYLRDGTILERGKFPENWDTKTEDEKQAFRDKKREKLAKEHGLEKPDEMEIPISTPRGNIIGKTNNKNATFIDIILPQMTQIVQGDKKKRMRHEYIRDEFSDFTGDKIIDAYFSRYIVGKIAIESGFDNSVNQDKNLELIQKKEAPKYAVGIMQIMPYNISNNQLNPNKYPFHEVEKQLRMQVEIAKNIARENYRIINKKYTKIVAEKYFNGDEDEAKEKFIAPLIFNTYNSGTGNISIVMDDFMKTFPDLKSTEKVLWSTKPGYDIYWLMTEHGRKNTIKWTVWWRIITENYGSQSSEYTLKAMAMTAVIENQNITTQATPEKIQKKESQKEKWFFWDIWHKIQSIFSSDGEYLEWDSKTTKLPRRIQSTHINPWFEKYANILKLKKAKNKSEIQYNSIPDRWPNYEYFLSKVGKNDDGEKFGDENDRDYTKLHPKAYKDILLIHKALEEKLREHNLDPDYTPTLKITSIARDMEYAKKYIGNASENSAHFYGIAFDISLETYITHKKTGETIKLKNKDHKIFLHSIESVIQRMHNEGKIFAMQEDFPPHIHIQSRLGK